MILAFIAVYVGFQLGLGAFVSRRIKNDEDYLVAGRSLGPALATASVFATWFGAETCVGAAGEVYAYGLSGIAADPFGYGLTLILFGLLVARPLWRAKVTTIADLYRNRFSPGVERAVALLMIPGSVLWAAAQIRAFGSVVASATDLLSVQDGLLIAALVTILYTSLGGLLADAYTDLIQGGVLIACLAVLAAFALSAEDAGTALTTALYETEANGAAPSVWERLEAWSIPILGSLFAQELAARAAASRSETLARRASVGAGGLYIAIGLMPVALGLLARVQLPGLEDGGAALPEMAELHLGPLGRGIFSGALVSAILSTIDSALLSAAGLLTHNLLGSRLRTRPDRVRLLASRVAVIGLGVLAWGLARSAESVHALVEEASAFGSSGFLVLGLGILFVRRGGIRTAYATLAAGVGGYMVATYWLKVEAPFLSSVAGAVAVWCAGALLEKAGPGATSARGPGILGKP